MDQITFNASDISIDIVTSGNPTSLPKFNFTTAEYYLNEITTNTSYETLPNETTSVPKFNATTAYEFDYELYLKYQKNRSVSDTTYWIILVSYTILIVMGTIGNLLVVSAVATNKGKMFPNTIGRPHLKCHSFGILIFEFVGQNLKRSEITEFKPAFLSVKAPKFRSRNRSSFPPKH